MKDRVFVDTNVFIYLYSEDEIRKQNISQKMIENYQCVISTQVLNEFSNVCLGKLKQSSNNVLLAVNEIINNCTVILVDEENIKEAIKIHKKYGYKYFDSLIISSALRSNCKYLFTEDLADGQIINNKLTLINIYSEKNNSQAMERLREKSEK